MPLIQFVGALAGTGVMVSLLSIVWPHISASPRPPVLDRVHAFVVTTPMGAGAEHVLGASTQAASDSGDVHILSAGSEVIVQKAREALRHAVTVRVIDQLAGQYDALNEAEKDMLRRRICMPAEEGTASAGAQ